MRSSLLLYGLLAYAGLQAVLVTAQEPRDRIIFPHVTHVEDMGLECGECHEGVETSTRLTHDLLPVMDQCLACHDGDTASGECAVCHTRPDDPQSYDWQPTPGLLFPHQSHLPQTECSQCHPTTASNEALVPRTPPKMEPCMDCHAVPLTDAGCYACHTSLEGKLPASHGLGWTGLTTAWCAMSRPVTLPAYGAMETKRLFVAGLAAGLVITMWGCTELSDEHRVHPGNWGTEHQAKVRTVNYDFTFCQSCHGDNLEGDAETPG